MIARLRSSIVVTRHAAERYVARFLRPGLTRREVSQYVARHGSEVEAALTRVFDRSRLVAADGESTYRVNGPVVLVLKDDSGIPGWPCVVTVLIAKEWRNDLAKRLTGARRMKNKPHVKDW